MKITKKPDEFDMNVYLREKVLKECYTCPFCGEMRTYNPFKADKSGKLIKPYGVWDRNIYHNKSVTVGFLKRKTMKIKHFQCMSCGAKWESDPYDDGDGVEFRKELIPVIFITLYMLLSIILVLVVSFL